MLTTDELGQLSSLLYAMRAAYEGDGCEDEACAYERALARHVGGAEQVRLLDQKIRELHLDALRAESA